MTTARVLVCVAIVLVAQALVEAPLADLRIVARATVLSWDSPATQALDELLGVASPPSRDGADAGCSARLASAGSRPLLPAAAPRPTVGCPRTSGITRAPPAA